MSIFGKILHAVGGLVAGDGNTPGTPATRKYGYDPTQVGQASAILLSAPASPNVQAEMLVLAVAGVGLILLLRKD